MSQEIGTVLVALAIFGSLVALMMRGWYRRAREQQDYYARLPEAPAEPGPPVLDPLEGVYVGTTLAGRWQERITRAPLGFRSAATLSAHTGGLLVELARDTVWIPRESIVSVRTESRLANKVVPGRGLLVVRWRVPAPDGGTTELDSGLRADDKDDYGRWTALSPTAASNEETE